MKKVLIFSLISGYLFMALILSHEHNHPLTQAGDDTCPAYIISSVIFSEDLPAGLSEVATVEFTGTYLPLCPAVLNPQTVPVHETNRAPPFSC